MQFTHDGRKTSLVRYMLAQQQSLALSHLLFFCLCFSDTLSYSFSSSVLHDPNELELDLDHVDSMDAEHPALTGRSQLLPFVHHSPAFFFLFVFCVFSGPEVRREVVG